MKRTALIEQLDLVAPALSGNDLVPLMMHFWFTGDDLITWNGKIGMVTPCKTDFDAAVPGLPLLNMLKAASSKEVTFNCNEQRVLVEASKAKINLVTMDHAQFDGMFKPPAPPKKALACDAKSFLRAIATCMRSVSQDTSIPDQLGVTLIPADDHRELEFYATDGTVMSKAVVPFKGEVPFEGRYILGAEFCKQLLSLAEANELMLRVNKDGATFAGPNVLLYGRLIDSAKPLRFSKVFEQHYDPGKDGGLVPIGEKLVKVLDRACIMASAEATTVRTRIEVRKGNATFYTKSRLGDIRDEMQMPEGQPDVSIDVDPKRLRSGVEDFDHMLITERCFVMANKGAYYLISGRGD